MIACCAVVSILMVTLFQISTSSAIAINQLALPSKALSVPVANLPATGNSGPSVLAALSDKAPANVAVAAVPEKSQPSVAAGATQEKSQPSLPVSDNKIALPAKLSSGPFASASSTLAKLAEQFDIKKDGSKILPPGPVGNFPGNIPNIANFESGREFTGNVPGGSPFGKNVNGDNDKNGKSADSTGKGFTDLVSQFKDKVSNTANSAGKGFGDLVAQFKDKVQNIQQQ